jgi:aldehyde:ferredoxin oxidoreductase
MSGKKLQKAGERIVNLERAFNILCGIRRKDDTLPERFLREPLNEGGSAGRLVDLELMLDEYYAARGWSKKDSIPSREKLVELGLKQVADNIKKFKS